MNDKLDLYPKLAGETLIYSPEEQRLVLFKSEDGAGYNIDGLAAQFCHQLDGRTKLRDVINEFREGEGARVPALENEVSRLLSRLQSNELVDFFEEPLETLD